MLQKQSKGPNSNEQIKDNRIKVVFPSCEPCRPLNKHNLPKVNKQEPNLEQNILIKAHQDYLDKHQKLSTKISHAVGWYAAVGTISYGIITTNPWLIPLGFMIGYGFAISSHYLFEGNRPKSFEGAQVLFEAYNGFKHGEKSFRLTLKEVLRAISIPISAFVSDAVMSLSLPLELLKSNRQHRS